MTDSRNKYDQQRNNARRRGIEFNITFEEWWDIWQQSGQWENRGRCKGQYVMSRYGDTGRYEVGNVFIQLKEHNDVVGYDNPSFNKGIITKLPKVYKDKIESNKLRSAALKGRPAHNKGIPCTDEIKEKISNTLKGRAPWNKGLKQNV